MLMGGENTNRFCPLTHQIAEQAFLIFPPVYFLLCRLSRSSDFGAAL